MVSQLLGDAPTGDFALIMIPAIAAPFALLLHTYSIRSVLTRAMPARTSAQVA
jgi:hypothetical protein